MLIRGFSHLSLAPSGPGYPHSHLVARVQLDSDITPVFPYVNAVFDRAVYFENPHYITFTMKDRYCALYPDSAVAAPFQERKTARLFMEKLIVSLNDLFADKNSISPDFRKKRYQPVLDIYRLLPGTNCGKCGLPSCMAFAAALSRGESSPELCPSLGEPMREQAVFPLCDESGNLISMVEIDRAESDREKPSSPSSAGNRYGLTGREVQVLGLVSRGHTNIEISGILFISSHTVKTHMDNIFNKLGVSDRTRAAVIGARENIV